MSGYIIFTITTQSEAHYAKAVKQSDGKSLRVSSISMWHGLHEAVTIRATLYIQIIQGALGEQAFGTHAFVRVHWCTLSERVIFYNRLWQRLCRNSLRKLTVYPKLTTSKDFGACTRSVQKIKWIFIFFEKYLFIHEFLCCPLQINPP